MTQVAAIAKSLLRGDTLSIMTGFKLFACSNLPREVSRSIEQKFDVRVTKTRREFTSKYGQPGFYFEYRLKATEENQEGIKKMLEYVKEQEGAAKTDQQDKVNKSLKQLELL